MLQSDRNLDYPIRGDFTFPVTHVSRRFQAE